MTEMAKPNQQYSSLMAEISIPNHQLISQLNQLMSEINNEFLNQLMTENHELFNQLMTENHELFNQLMTENHELFNQLMTENHELFNQLMAESMSCLIS
jgi:TRAP-type C4-dicarboxylate transport system substrate-binding protein